MLKISWCVFCALCTLFLSAQDADSTAPDSRLAEMLPPPPDHFFVAGYLNTTLKDSFPLGRKSFSTRRRSSEQTLSLRSIVLPSAMIAYGAFTFSNKDLKKLNLAVRTKLWEDREESKRKPFHLDNFTLVAPAIAVYALNIAGVKGKNNLVDASIIYGMSHLIGQLLIVNNVKKLTDIMRPDSSNRLSFPSGHTAQAFISAEFLRREYQDVSPWYGVAGYAVAVGTGFLRMYNNKHWLNDVMAGAGVGILSTRISYWLYPKLKKTFIGKWKGNTIVAPTYQNRSFGFGMVHNF